MQLVVLHYSNRRGAKVEGRNPRPSFYDLGLPDSTLLSILIASHSFSSAGIALNRLPGVRNRSRIKLGFGIRIGYHEDSRFRSRFGARRLSGYPEFVIVDLD